MPPSVQSLDHLVLTVTDPDRSCRFYADVLGMEVERFAATDGSTRLALRFGAQKINLHVAGQEFTPHAARPAPGAADLCFLSATRLDDWQVTLAERGIDILDGPVRRTGAAGPLMSVYIRDPDGNLIEISNQI